jgi:acetoin utilization protein AcuB
MRVADVMQSTVVTISSQTTLPVATRVMRAHGVRHLPVVDDGLLLGLVSTRDLARALPSPATSLARYEVQSLLDRVTAKEIMSRPVIVVEPSRALEEAVRLMRAEGISALPVTEAGRLVGLLTEGDVLDLVLATTRAVGSTSRVEVTVPEGRSGLADVIHAIEATGAPIAHLTTVAPPDGRRRAVIEVGIINPRQVVAALKAGGYDVEDLWRTRPSDRGGSREPRPGGCGDSWRATVAAGPGPRLEGRVA